MYNTIIDNTYTNLVRFSYPKAMQLTLPNTMNKNKTFLNFLITAFWVKTYYSKVEIIFVVDKFDYCSCQLIIL